MITRSKFHLGRAVILALCVYVLALGLSGSMWASCTPQWAQGLFLSNHVGGLVSCVYDDGTGPALYIGGTFNMIGGVPASNIARWKNGSWSALGSGTNGSVRALCVYDDGTGPALYVGGYFTTAGGVTVNSIAKWKNGSWSALGSGMQDFVYALCVYNDGTGPALYAGGKFSTAGGVTAHGIAKWKNGSWSAVGDGVSGVPYPYIHSLCVYNDGTGSALYAGGYFTEAGGVTVNNIARWKNGSWSALGSGMNNIVWDLCVYNDGTGSALYAGGEFTTAGSVTAKYIAMWKNGSWSALGSGMPAGSHVYALRVYDDGAGSALYAGGKFTTAGGVTVNNIAKWQNGSWSALGSGMNDDVHTICAYNDGTGYALYARGDFTTAGDALANGFARWKNDFWSALGSSGLNERVHALCVYNDGTGSALYAGGSFTIARGITVNYIARWNSGPWSALGSGMNDSVEALCVYDDGTGSALYAGGKFTTAGGVTVNSIAKWQNGSWSALGSGMSDGSQVYALCVYDDGTGPALYAGGSFTTAGGVTVNNIAKWQNGSWSALGSGMNDSVSDLCVYDDGTGPALYAGGDFTTAGGVAARRVAMWKNGYWSALGNGLGGTTTPSVNTLCVYDDGTGPTLYAGGSFSPPSSVRKWKNGSWLDVGSICSTTNVLCVHDDGTGPALYAGGSFPTADGVTVNNIAKWQNGSWSALGSGIGGNVYALCVYDDGTGPALYAGGNIGTAGGYGSSYMARWGCETITNVTDTAAAKLLHESTLISLTGPASTAVFGDTFYVESQDRFSGIRVDLPGHSILKDRQVSVTGRILTNMEGERYIYGFSASDLGPLSVDPLGLNLKALGGGNWQYDPVTGAGQQGVIDGYGLCNIGLLVRCAGQFIPGGISWFYIDDGSPTRVLVTVPWGVTINSAWDHIGVTGISSCIKADDGLLPLIRVRAQSDIDAD